MLRTLPLINQLKRACQTVSEDASPSDQYLLSLVNSVLNEFIRRDDPAFYLSHIETGAALLQRAVALWSNAGGKPPSIPAAAYERFHGDLRHDVLAAEIHRIEQGLTQIASLLQSSLEGDAGALVADMCEWSAALWIHRSQPAPPLPEPAVITRTGLQQYLRRKFPESRSVEVIRFTALDGGYSKQTILVECSEPLRGHTSLVVRAEQPVSLLIGWDGSDITREVNSIRLVRDAGLPVPEILWLEDDASVLGTRFVVSTMAPGRRVGASLGSSENLSIDAVESVLTLLGRTHSVDVGAHRELAEASHLAEWLDFETVEECSDYMAHGFLDKMLERSDIHTTPALVRGMQWLRSNVPSCDEPPVLLHYDFALNNMLFEDNRVTALLDWETSRLGDPADDLNWTQQNLAEYLTMPELLDRYESMSGRRVTEFRLAYARVARCMMNMMAFQRSLQSLDRDPDTNLNLFTLAIDYPGLLGAELNRLIEAAEAAR